MFNPLPSPLTLATVMAPAEKFPEASRLTIVAGVLAEVAALAALTPPATFAALCPPTLATTVAPWGPVTLPASEPVKLSAVVAVAALPARLPVIVPAEKFPFTSRFTMVPGVLTLVAAMAALAPLATLAALWPPTEATTVAPWVPVTWPASAPMKFVAAVAVAAVPALGV